MESVDALPSQTNYQHPPPYRGRTGNLVTMMNKNLDKKSGRTSDGALTAINIADGRDSVSAEGNLNGMENHAFVSKRDRAAAQSPEEIWNSSPYGLENTDKLSETYVRGLDNRPTI